MHAMMHIRMFDERCSGRSISRSAERKLSYNFFPIYRDARHRCMATAKVINFDIKFAALIRKWQKFYIEIILGISVWY